MIRKEEVYKIGILNKPHGVRGELQFTFDDDIFDRTEAEYIVCLIDGILVPFFIEGYRFRSASTAIIKLEDVDTEAQARRLTNTEVYFPKALADVNETESLSWNYFIGFRIVDTHGTETGTITDVDDSTANVLFIADRGGEELLIPAHEEFIAGIDTERKVVTMNLPDGLLSLSDGSKDQDKDI